MKRRISPNLMSHETQCRCGCGYGSKPSDFDPKLLDTFEKIRFLLNMKLGKKNVPVLVSGPARCLKHNREVYMRLYETTAGADGSKHCPDRWGKCRALDIYQNAVRNKQFHDWILAWQEEGLLPHLGGLGEYHNRVHIDTHWIGRLRRWHG